MTDTQKLLEMGEDDGRVTAAFKAEQDAKDAAATEVADADTAVDPNTNAASSADGMNMKSTDSAEFASKEPGRYDLVGEAAVGSQIEVVQPDAGQVQPINVEHPQA